MVGPIAFRLAGAGWLGSNRSVVVNNPPPGGRAAKQQSEQTRWRVLRSLQSPTAKGQRRVRSQGRNFDLAEGQRAHARPIGVALLIALENSLPAERNIAAGLKPRPAGPRVTFHETAKITCVPGADLRIEHGADLAISAGCRFRRHMRAAAAGQEQKNRKGDARPNGSRRPDRLAI